MLRVYGVIENNQSHSKVYQFLPRVLKKKAHHYKYWITRLQLLGGCPGVKPPVGVTVLLPVADSVGLGEDLCTSSHLITICSIQVPPFDLPFNKRKLRVTWCQPFSFTTPLSSYVRV